MKKSTAVILTALALGLPAITTPAQDGNPPPARKERPPQRDGHIQPRPGGDQGQRPPAGGREGQPGGPGRDGQRPPMRAQEGDQPRPAGDGQRPVPPLFAALDANHDGVIDETEIAQAPAALRKLDKNGDGKLTADELRAPRPGGAGGPGGGGEGDRSHRPGGPEGPRADRQRQGNDNPPPPPQDGQARPPRTPRPPQVDGQQ